MTAHNPSPLSAERMAELRELLASGWAVIRDGSIDVRTVSDTRRAAIVNWLVTEKQFLVTIVTTDEQIETLWHTYRGTAEVAPVSINLLASSPTLPDVAGAKEPPCQFGCKQAVGLYHLPRGCPCHDTKEQWLCEQHLVKLRNNGYEATPIFERPRALPDVAGAGLPQPENTPSSRSSPADRSPEHRTGRASGPGRQIGVSIEAQDAGLRAWMCCGRCGRAHMIDTSIPSEIWNKIAPDGGILCTTCIDDLLVAHGLTCEAEFFFGGRALNSKMYAAPPIAEDNTAIGGPIYDILCDFTPYADDLLACLDVAGYEITTKPAASCIRALPDPPAGGETT